MIAKFQPRSILYHLEKKVHLYIDSVQFVPHKGFLYKIKVLDTVAESGYKAKWKSYYENKIEDVCKMVVNPNTVELLYGKENS